MKKHRRTPRRATTIAEIFEGKAGWRFRLIARNGKVIAPSQAYSRRRDAVRGAVRVNPSVEVRYR